MQVVQLKNFKGINFEEGNWSQSFSRYNYGIDLFGLQDNVSKQSIPGVLQAARILVAGTEAAATNNITDLIRSFAEYPLNGVNGGALEPWGLSDANRLYKRVASNSTWTLQQTTGADGGGGGLATFGGSLWVSENAVVNRWVGSTSTWTTSYGTFTTGGTTPRPMKSFAGNLYIGNDRYISKIDSNLSFSATALTLPLDFVVKDIEVFGDRMYIFADNGNFSRLIIWDGISTTFNSYFDLYQETTAPHIIFHEGMLWCVGTRGIATGTPVYIFNGSTFQKVMSIPIGVFNSYDRILSTYQGGILIGSTNTGTAIIEDGTAGVWTINRYDASHPYSSSILFAPSAGVLGTQIGAVFTTGSSVYVSTFNANSSAYEVWEAQGATSDTATTGVFQTLPIDCEDAARTKSFHGIKIDSELPKDGATGSRTIVIKYRIDYASSWTTLKTLASGTSASDSYVQLGKTGKVIELRFEITSATNFISTRQHGAQLYYSNSTL